MYRCPICGELFTCSEKLQKHDNDKHNGVVYSERFVDDEHFVQTLNNIQQTVNYNYTQVVL